MRHACCVALALSASGCQWCSAGAFDLPQDDLDDAPCDRSPDDLASELSQGQLTRSPCAPVANADEANFLAQQDARNLAPIALTAAYAPLLDELLRRASISAPRVVFGVATDLQTAYPIGGGVTGHDFVLVDGKFLDILSEYSVYLAMVDFGFTDFERSEALSLIVPLHNAQAGVNLAPQFFLYDELSPDAQAWAAEIMLSLAAFILYHEYGHYYLASALEKTQRAAAGLPPEFIYDNDFEDDADEVSGMLTAKALLFEPLAEDAIDLMAFQLMNRQYFVSDIAEVEESYSAQLTEGFGYSSLATRKQTFSGAFQHYAAQVCDAPSCEPEAIDCANEGRQYCGAGLCVDNDADCFNGLFCADEYQACAIDEEPNCGDRAGFACCPAELPSFCDNADASCWDLLDIDCETITACEGGFRACVLGRVPYCGSFDFECCSPEAVFCDVPSVGQGCAVPGSDCSTMTLCESGPRVCPFDTHVNCDTGGCDPD